MINGNILIAGDHKFAKIYDDEDQKIAPSIQNYYNFLPSPEKDRKDRCMPANLLHNCPKHSRLLMQFNYPVSCKPKQILVTPSISDNVISMNSRTDSKMFSWLASDGEDNPSRIFQFSPSKRMLLNEFDLVGVMKKQTSFAEIFHNKQILAFCQQKLRYLITPEAEDHLKKMSIIEIKENHSCDVVRTIETDKIHVKIGNQPMSLFDLMFEMKNKLECSFEFKFNSEKM